MFNQHENEEHGLHIPHFHLPVSRELAELYASHLIRAFAVYLIGIFIPIYLYLHFGKSASLMLLFVGATNIIFGLVVPLGAKALSKIGVKHAMLASVPFYLIYYLGLWHAESLGIFIWALPMVVVIGKVLYWPAYHVDFARFSDEGKRGRELSFRTILLSMAAASAPFIGGFIITQYGFPVLFAVVLTLFFASAAPLFLTKEIHEEYKDSYIKALKTIPKEKYRKKAVAFAAFGVDYGTQVYIWPLFLFVLAINFEELGIITSATLLIGIIFTYFIGKASDRIGPEKMLAIGAVLSALFWPIKIFVTAPLDAFLANTLHRFGRTSASIPFSSLFYDWAAEHEDTRDRNIILREISLNMGRGIYLLFLAVIFLFTSNLAIAFIFAVFGALARVLIIDNPIQALKGKTKGSQ